MHEEPIQERYENGFDVGSNHGGGNGFGNNSFNNSNYDNQDNNDGFNQFDGFNGSGDRRESLVFNKNGFNDIDQIEEQQPQPEATQEEIKQEEELPINPE